MKHYSGNKRKVSRPGFTLIEFVIYFSIISIVLTVTTFVAWDVFSLNIKSQAYREAIFNTQFIMGRLQSTINQSKDIISVSSNTLVLASPDGSEATFVIDETSQQLLFNESGGGISPLSANTVDVAGLFTDLSHGNSRNIGIHLQVSYKNPNNIKDYQAELVIDTASELKAR